MSQSPNGYEYPEQSYFPRWKARLVFRFAEFGQTTLQSQVPGKPTRSLSGTDLSRGNLTVAIDADAPEGVTRYVLVGPVAETSGGPQAQEQSSDELTQALEGVVPREFKWSQNGVRTADTLSMMFPFIACPIDPRTVRSCAVEFALGTVTAQQAGGQLTGTAARTGGLDLIPDTYTDAAGNPRTNIRFQGWVDEWNVEWTREDQPVIHIECVDNTYLFIKMPAPAKAVVSKDLPIDQAVAKYLTFSPSFAGLAVEYRPAGAVAPVLKDVLSRSAFLPGQGPPVAKMGSPAGSAEKISVWDYLTDLCRSLGHSIFVEGTTLVIQRIRSLTSANVQGRADDPYKGRTLPGGLFLPTRRMLWGRNVKEMRLKRNFSKNAPVNVSVRAYNPEQKKIIVERFPLAHDRQVYVLPGNTTPDEKWLELTIGGGVTDTSTLKIFAQEVYEQLGRREIEWQVKTDNFASFGGGNTDPDLLDIRPTDALEILVARDDVRSTPTQMENRLAAYGTNARYLQDLGFSEKFADAYAKAYTNAGFQNVYRVKQVDITGSVEPGEGVEINVECVNYLEVTSDKSLDDGLEPTVNSPGAPPAPPAAPPPPSGPTP